MNAKKRLSLDYQLDSEMALKIFKISGSVRPWDTLTLQVHGFELGTKYWNAHILIHKIATLWYIYLFDDFWFF